MEHTMVSGSAAETGSLGARLAEHLTAGDVVAVAGELGSGKTTFIRGACRALGVEAPVTSPTYTIGHRYDGPVPVAHLDLYRLSPVTAEDWGSLEPYFDGTIAFVEWPEHAAGRLERVRAAVRMEHVDEAHRRITIDSEDDLRL
jgi:tRNA threonylcarbamoyladenosine biosynthesis protein TsaE